MKKISLKEALRLYRENPICKRKLTPYWLIINEIITYDDWLEALRHNNESQYDMYHENFHLLIDTTFGVKIISFLKKMGWDNFQFGRKYKHRSTNSELESIKLINITIYATR